MRYDNGIYTVGWISAIDEEYFAARRFLKDQHEPKWKRPGDENHYTLGKVANHNIVATVLPQGDNGPTAAATLLKDLSASFPNVKVCLMVGVGGGAPSERHDIRLGDVVVSAPDWAGEGGNQGGVIHYDYARTLRNKRFESISYMNRPPSALLAAVRALSVKYEENDGSKINAVINEIFADLSEEQRQKYCRPDPSSDKLYSSEPVQIEGVEETPRLIERTQRPHNDPVIHRGTIASASGFMEDAQTRDILAKERGVLCFEMEAAGMMNTFPCLVIRGICDYSDKHWVKGWRGYAAMAAAAYARDLLGELPAREVDNLRAIYDLLPSEYKAPVGKALKYVFGDETNEEGFTQADVEESLSMGNNKDPKNARLAQEGQRQAKPGLDSNDVNARKEREILELKERMASMELERKKFEDMMKELRLQKEALEQEAKKYVDREKAREQEHEDVSCRLEAERQAKEKANSERRYVNGGDAPLHDAALNGKADVVRSLLNQKYFVDVKQKDGSTPLHHAARNGFADIVKLLLDQGAIINAKKNTGTTPLHLGSWFGRTDVVRVLLNRGADTNAERADGVTPLHDAAQNGHADIVQLLLDRGANIEARKDSGTTALHFGAWYGKTDVVRLLLDRNANTEAMRDDGITPLHYAAQNGQVGAVKLLLKYGANTEAKQKDKLTPLGLARLNKKTDVVHLLLPSRTRS